MTTELFEHRPYFASDTGAGYQLQKNDALGKFETDEEAVQCCLADALKGDLYALRQLVRAAEDPLVKKHVGEMK